MDAVTGGGEGVGSGKLKGTVRDFGNRFGGTASVGWDSDDFAFDADRWFASTLVVRARKGMGSAMSGLTVVSSDCEMTLLAHVDGLGVASERPGGSTLFVCTRGVGAARSDHTSFDCERSWLADM